MLQCLLVVVTEKEKNVSAAGKLAQHYGEAHDGELSGDGGDDDGSTVVHQGIKETIYPSRYSYGTSLGVQRPAAHIHPHTTATGRNIIRSQRTKATHTVRSHPHNDYNGEKAKEILLQAPAASNKWADEKLEECD